MNDEQVRRVFAAVLADPPPDGVHVESVLRIGRRRRARRTTAVLTSAAAVVAAAVVALVVAVPATSPGSAAGPTPISSMLAQGETVTSVTQLAGAWRLIELDGRGTFAGTSPAAGLRWPLVAVFTSNAEKSWWSAGDGCNDHTGGIVVQPDGHLVSTPEYQSQVGCDGMPVERHPAAVASADRAVLVPATGTTPVRLVLLSSGRVVAVYEPRTARPGLFLPLSALPERDAAGAAVDVGDLKGRPVVLVRTATWCAPCGGADALAPVAAAAAANPGTVYLVLLVRETAQTARELALRTTATNLRVLSADAVTTPADWPAALTGDVPGLVELDVRHVIVSIRSGSDALTALQASRPGDDPGPTQAASIPLPSALAPYLRCTSGLIRRVVTEEGYTGETAQQAARNAAGLLSGTPVTDVVPWYHPEVIAEYEGRQPRPGQQFFLATAADGPIGIVTAFPDLGSSRFIGGGVVLCADE